MNVCPEKTLKDDTYNASSFAKKEISDSDDVDGGDIAELSESIHFCLAQARKEHGTDKFSGITDGEV